MTKIYNFSRTLTVQLSVGAGIIEIEMVCLIPTELLRASCFDQVVQDTTLFSTYC